MYKRGQITLFVILGIVFLLVLFLLFFFRDSLFMIKEDIVDVPVYLDTEMQSVVAHVQSCLSTVGYQRVQLFMSQGGSFSPEHFISYYTVPRRVWCSAITDSSQCLHKGLTTASVETVLASDLREKLLPCIHSYSWQSDYYTITRGSLNVSVVVGDKQLLLTALYPVTFTKGKDSVTHDTYFASLDVPVGDLLYAVQDIVNVVASGKEFTPQAFELSHFNYYAVDKKTRYPDVVYFVSVKDKPYTFAFAVEGYNAY